MSFAMSVTEREQFLAGLHVGVLSVAVKGDGEAGGDRGPLAVPVWYDYQAGGQVSVITGRGSRKGQAIRAAGRMSLCAQDENPPYLYVSVEGPAVVEELDPAERLAMARRYLSTEGGDQYVASNPDPDREMVMFRMRPEHWVSAVVESLPAGSGTGGAMLAGWASPLCACASMRISGSSSRRATGGRLCTFPATARRRSGTWSRRSACR